MAKPTIFGANALLGGADGALDSIDGAILVDGDLSVVVDIDKFAPYQLDDDSGAAESSPLVIAPDDNPGDKRWILKGGVFAHIILPDGGTIGQVAGPLLTFNDTDNILKIEGCVEVDVISANGSQAKLLATTYRDGSGGTALELRHARGTQGSKTLTTIGSVLGQVDFDGWDGANWLTGARIKAIVDTNSGSEDMPTRLEFSTTADGDSVPTLRMTITPDGKVGIAGRTDISYGGICLVLGADDGATTRTDETVKNTRMGAAHYLIAEPPMALLYAQSSGDGSFLMIGGGTGQLNASTEIRFYTAADTTTTAGTLRMTLSSDGLLTVVGAIASGTLTFSTEGPTDNLDVSGINTLFIDNSGGPITIGGFAGGVDGQVLNIVLINAGANNVTIEHDEAEATQTIYLHKGTDETLNTEYGGWTFVCHAGTDWHDVGHAQHVAI